MTTDEAKRKVIEDADRMSTMDKLGDVNAYAMARALMVDSIDTLVSAAKAEGSREDAQEMAALAEWARTQPTTEGE